MFREPGSYTGEESVEFTGHGGLLVTREVLSRFLACGAVPAGPGEFTQRAFLNGRLDLTQAEAVMDLISAQTHLALRAAREVLFLVTGAEKADAAARAFAGEPSERTPGSLVRAELGQTRVVLDRAAAAKL